MATILILDDEPSNLEIMTAILARQGHEVLAAADAEQALEHARTHDGQIDLVLADVILRGQNAAQLAGIIEAYRPGVPFLFVSGYSLEALRPIFSGAGMTGDPVFLGKPFTVDRLVTEVRALLEGRLTQAARA